MSRTRPTVNFKDVPKGASFQLLSSKKWFTRLAQPIFRRRRLEYIVEDSDGNRYTSQSFPDDRKVIPR